MKMIKNQVSLKGKIIQIHYKNNDFEGLAGYVRERTEKVSNKHQNDTKKHTKIYEQIMLKLCSKKRCEKTGKSLKMRSQRDPKSIPKSIKK